MTIRRLLLLLSVLLCARSVQAQPTTSYTVKIINQSTSAVVQTTVVPVAQFTCGQAKVTVTPPVVNPKHIYFDDPAAPTTADCVYTDNGTGLLSTLPFGSTTYVATIAATNAAGTSADSAVSGPFSHPGAPPAVPTGARVGS